MSQMIDLVVADLVTHAKRPGSYGFINSITNDREDGGEQGRIYHVRFQVGTEWATNADFHEPEPCSRADLVPISCPGCGEPQCWYGVGR